MITRFKRESLEPKRLLKVIMKLNHPFLFKITHYTNQNNSCNYIDPGKGIPFKHISAYNGKDEIGNREYKIWHNPGTLQNCQHLHNYIKNRIEKDDFRNS